MNECPLAKRVDTRQFCTVRIIKPGQELFEVLKLFLPNTMLELFGAEVLFIPINFYLLGNVPRNVVIAWGEYDSRASKPEPSDKCLEEFARLHILFRPRCLGDIPCDDAEPHGLFPPQFLLSLLNGLMEPFG